MKILGLRPSSAVELQNEAVHRVLLANLDALYRTARHLTGRADAAEDLVQETARKALEATLRSRTTEARELGCFGFS